MRDRMCVRRIAVEVVEYWRMVEVEVGAGGKVGGSENEERERDP